MVFALRYAARSDVGLLRQGNEDSAYAGPQLLVVADGMGGHVGGEVASAVAVATLATLDTARLARDEPDSYGDGEVLGRLAEAVTAANQQLRRISTVNPALEGMGTTVTALMRDGEQLGLAHIGDSRCYQLRGGTLALVTTDHTLVQSLVDEGRISAEEALTHPQRSLLTRALDGRDDVEPDLIILDVQPGDRYLLCSDGLSGVVGDSTLEATLGGVADPDAACEALVDLALRAGGPDNITCVVADLVEADGTPMRQRLVVGAATAAVTVVPVDTEPPDPTVAGTVPAQPEPAAPAPADPVPAGPHPEAGGTAGAVGTAPSTDTTTPLEPVTDEAPRSRSPLARLRRRGPLLLVVPVLLLLLLAAGGYGAYAWSQTQYFVGSHDGQVAIYQGLRPGVGGSALSRVVERPGLQLSALPPYEREKVAATIFASDLPEARRIVTRLQEQARSCPSAPPAPCEDLTR